MVYYSFKIFLSPEQAYLLVDFLLNFGLFFAQFPDCKHTQVFSYRYSSMSSIDPQKVDNIYRAIFFAYSAFFPFSFIQNIEAISSSNSRGTPLFLVHS